MSHLPLLSRRSLLSLLSVGDPVAVCLHLYCDSSATRLPAAVTALTSDAVGPETFVRLYIANSKCCLRSNIRSHLPSFSALPSIAPFAVMACNSCKRSTRARRIVCRYTIGVQAVTPWTSRTQTFRSTTTGSQRHGRRKSRRLGCDTCFSLRCSSPRPCHHQTPPYLQELTAACVRKAIHIHGKKASVASPSPPDAMDGHDTLARRRQASLMTQRREQTSSWQ
ncbi:hypothetical protein KC343_g42 [Hortaea werneckii]|nr:hypothetical protein KC343_g42 [Hortaea werneckii]